MTVHVRKYGAAKQVHEAGDKGVCHTKAVIDEHGYTLKITVELDYNRLTNRRIPFAHKAMYDVITSALDTADSLRGSNPAMWETDDLLDLQPAPTIDNGPRTRMIRTLFNIASWMLNHGAEEIDRILHNATAQEQPGPWGHTLTLTVGPSDDLTYEWRCHEPLSAFCREDREESDGCLFIERIEDSGTPWNQLTFDGWDEEFPPLQVDFVDQAGQLHWYGVQEPES